MASTQYQVSKLALRLFQLTLADWTNSFMAMKYTLLEMVQQILRSMKGDEVTSYTDTEESTSVAHIIKECFFDMTGLLDLPEHEALFQLDVTSATTPVVMTVPSTVRSIQWIKYDRISEDVDAETSQKFTDVTFLTLDKFLAMVSGLNSDDNTSVTEYTFTHRNSSDAFALKCWNDRQPQYWTSIDDYYILFDAYKVLEDDYLVAEKTMCYGLLAPTFTLSDSFEAPLDHNQFALLLNEARSQAMVQLRNQADPKSEQKARRNLISTQKRKQNVGYPNNQMWFNNFPNYGRK
jgi:hypothetical protein